jgi:hypothetical protein
VTTGAVRTYRWRRKQENPDTCYDCGLGSGGAFRCAACTETVRTRARLARANQRKLADEVKRLRQKLTAHGIDPDR